jgi:hypothetical protein
MSPNLILQGFIHNEVGGIPTYALPAANYDKSGSSSLLNGNPRIHVHVKSAVRVNVQS